MLPALALAAQEQADSLQRSPEEVTVEAAAQSVTPEKAVFIDYLPATSDDILH